VARWRPVARPVAAQLRGCFADLPGIGLDLGFQPDRGLREVVSFKGLVGGNGGQTCKSDERGSKAGTKMRKHGQNPPPRYDRRERNRGQRVASGQR
jgi:hypothetical protein